MSGNLKRGLRSWDKHGKLALNDAEVIIEAARKWANPDYKAAAMVSQIVGKPSRWWMEHTKRIVDAALGITEDE